MNLKSNKIIIPAAIVIAGLLIAGSVIYFKKDESKVLSSQQAAEKAINYVNQVISAQGATDTAVLVNTTTTDSGVYQVGFKIRTYDYNLFISKDGKYLFPEAYDLAAISEAQQQQENNNNSSNNSQPAKSDRPDVKLFVMSYCPYGLQAEKMYLPVYNLLKDKADIGIYFVDYAMHDKQEMDENLRQYCIQKNNKAEYYDYLSCFVKAGNSDNCLSEAKIDKTKLASCVAQTDAQYKLTEMFNDKSTWIGSTCPEPPYCFPQFDVNADLNEQYGVQGSPTIVINGTIAEVSPRSPEKFKEIVCDAFNVAPQECQQALSGDAASVSFGEGTAANGASSGSCE